jgi:hypothetical protein
MRKYLLISVLFLNTTLAYNYSEAFCYKMVSYDRKGGGGFSGRNTPLFNTNIFNEECFPIATRDNLTGSGQTRSTP